VITGQRSQVPAFRLRQRLPGDSPTCPPQSRPRQKRSPGAATVATAS